MEKLSSDIGTRDNRLDFTVETTSILSQRAEELKASFESSIEKINGQLYYCYNREECDSAIARTSALIRYLAHPSEFKGLDRNSTETEIFSIRNAFSTIPIPVEELGFFGPQGPDNQMKIVIEGNGFSKTKYERVRALGLVEFVEVVES